MVCNSIFFHIGRSSKQIYVVHYEEITGFYDDGEAFSLLKPTYELQFAQYGQTDDLLLSPRTNSSRHRYGLLEAIPERRLEDLSDPNRRW